MMKNKLMIFALLCAFAQGAWAQNYDVWDGVTMTEPYLYTGHDGNYYNNDIANYYNRPVAVIRSAADLAWVVFSNNDFDYSILEKNKHVSYALDAMLT